ncbi:unnamed protein product, partial [Mesorhabditis spiculigera]
MWALYFGALIVGVSAQVFGAIDLGDTGYGGAPVVHTDPTEATPATSTPTPAPTTVTTPIYTGSYVLNGEYCECIEDAQLPTSNSGAIRTGNYDDARVRNCDNIYTSRPYVANMSTEEWKGQGYRLALSVHLYAQDGKIYETITKCVDPALSYVAITRQRSCVRNMDGPANWFIDLESKITPAPVWYWKAESSIDENDSCEVL